jgi:Raf kinase inhibitor-like YbhB/YbcL family protein
MRLTSTSFADNERIPECCAFGIEDPGEHMRFGPNRNPQLSWSDLPDGTKSLVLICTDPDAPASADDVNQEGKSIPVDFPRADFTHWVVVDIPPEEASLAEGACSRDVTPGGKDYSPGPGGAREGINDYTGFLAGNPDMQGEYFGFDGPCPPWNDERLHHYNFVMYATDLESCPVTGMFTGTNVKNAIEGHVLAKAGLTGTYCLNPTVG